MKWRVDIDYMGDEHCFEVKEFFFFFFFFFFLYFLFLFFSKTPKKTLSGTVINIISVCVTTDALINIVDNFYYELSHCMTKPTI